MRNKLSFIYIAQETNCVYKYNYGKRKSYNYQQGTVSDRLYEEIINKSTSLGKLCYLWTVFPYFKNVELSIKSQPMIVKLSSTNLKNDLVHWNRTVQVACQSLQITTSYFYKTNRFSGVLIQQTLRSRLRACYQTNKPTPPPPPPLN